MKWNMVYVIYLAHTVRNFPPQVKNLNLPHRGQKSFRNKDGDILVTGWRDKKAKKPVVVVSTKSVKGDIAVQHEEGEVMIPTVVNDYNLNMNGCDRLDQMVNYYGHYSRKTRKWWKRLFYWLIEVAQINSFILYKLKKNLPALTLKDYKLALFMQLLAKAGELGDHAASARPVGRPTSTPVERLQNNVHLVDFAGKDRNCVVCSTPTDRKRTTYICVGCSDKPFLHPKGCFRKYHTQLQYK
jgi:hypothetical protein